MPRTPLPARVLDSLIEFGWLFLIVAVPTFFNVHDERVFEPDKIVVMRNVTLVMVLLFLAKWLYLAPWYLGRRSTGAGGAQEAGANTRARGIGTYIGRWPLVCAALLFAIVYSLATWHSILPYFSFWGSYDRAEGLYTYLTYVTLFLIVAAQLRSWNQIERLVTAVILGSIPAATYSWIQHFQQDPLSWGGTGTDLRTPSTMGNPIFLAAFMLMAVPFTLYRLVLGVQRILETDTTASATPRRPSSVAARRGSNLDSLWPAVGTVGYGVALIVQMAAIGFSGSRGPALGFLAAVLVFALCIAIRQRITWLTRVAMVATVGLVLVLGVTNTALRSGSTPQAGLGRFLHLLPSESDTSEVRSLLWKSAPSLSSHHLLLGCGPETLLFCWNPEYPAALHKVELSNAAPDRSHDEEIDVLLMSGVLGIASYLLVLAAGIVTMVKLLRGARTFRSALLVSALLGAFIGHIFEGVTGIAFSSTLLLLWLVLGAAAALHGARAGAAAFYLPVQATAAAAIPSGSTPLPEEGGGRAGAPARGRGNAPRRGRQAQTSPRREPRVVGYRFGAGLSRLGAGLQALLGLGALLWLALAVGCGFLFAANVESIMADVNYRTGTAYENAANQYTSSGHSAADFQQGYGYYQVAIDNYQQALNAAPREDTYYLFLGKALLEYADALNRDPSHATPRSQVIGEIQQALDVFARAARNNPYNPDHPRNVAKLYEYWGYKAFGQPDHGKLLLADQNFARAEDLAPHNPDIYDEQANLEIELGVSFPTEGHRWYALARRHLETSIALYDGESNAYRDIGMVYVQYGQWADAARDKAAAHTYYVMARDAWLKALGAPPVTRVADQYQTLYPQLAQLYLQHLNDVCDAGQYANFALKASQAGTLSQSNAGTMQALQQVVSTAQARKCALAP